MSRSLKLLTIAVVALTLSACASKRVVAVKNSIQQHNFVAERIELGDSKENVLSVLQPSLSALPEGEKKMSERLMEDGKLVEIFFARSALQKDDLVTDDEFIPYVFEDGKLVAIGWEYLGGPKTQAQVKPEERTVFIRSGFGFSRFSRRGFRRH